MVSPKVNIDIGQKPQSSHLKWFALSSLVGQSVVFAVTFRYARLHEEGPGFSNLTAVFFSELVKLLVSVIFMYASPEENHLFARTRENAWSFVLMSVPGVLYAVQNYLYFLGISNVSITLYQVGKQFNILTTSVLSVIVLGKHISWDRWISLLVLIIGVCAATVNGDSKAKGSISLGMTAIFLACWISGFAGVFTELMLKKGKYSIWERNVQLSLFGIIFSGIAVLRTKSKDPNASKLEGFTGVVWALVFIQALGGILTAAVMKYADNVIKCVSKAFAVVVSVVISRKVFGEGPRLDSINLQLGVFAVLFATALYQFGFDGLRSLCEKAGGIGAVTSGVAPATVVGKIESDNDYEMEAIDEEMLEVVAKNSLKGADLGSAS